jgi:hypothetical protein
MTENVKLNYRRQEIVMSNITKPTPIWLQKELTNLAAIYTNSPEKFNNKMKQKVVEITRYMGVQAVAENLHCHRTTVQRWCTRVHTKSVNADKQGAQRMHTFAQDAPMKFKTQFTASLVLLVALEIFLAQQSFKLARDVFHYDIFNSFLMCIIIEMIPIVFAVIHKASTRSLSIGLCLAGSFLLSVYCSVGTDLKRISDAISTKQALQHKKKTFNNQINGLEKEINYFNTAVRVDGKGVGWPHKVAKLQEEKKDIQRKISEMPIENSSFDFSLLITSIIMRIIFQLASVTLSRTIFLVQNFNMITQKEIESIALKRCLELRDHIGFCCPSRRDFIKKTFRLNHSIFFQLTKKRVYETTDWQEIYGTKDQDSHFQCNPALFELLPWQSWES